MRNFLFILMPLLVSACAKPDSICNNKELVGQINSIQFNLKTACSNEEKTTGLMNIRELPKDNGMIFVYDKEDYYAFWMKNTYIPLSIAFLDENKKIVDIRDMKPHDLTPVPTRFKAIYAIEMNLNWFTSNNIKVGDKFAVVN